MIRIEVCEARGTFVRIGVFTLPVCICGAREQLVPLTLMASSMHQAMRASAATSMSAGGKPWHQRRHMIS